MSKVTLLPSVLFLLVAFMLPESPLWLIRLIIIITNIIIVIIINFLMIRKGRVDESRKVVQWLRGSHYSIEPEVKEMEAVIR